MENTTPMDHMHLAMGRRRGLSYSRVAVCPTTGGRFDLMVPKCETVQGLKNVLARRLKIHHSRINLSMGERLLKSGTLLENNFGDFAQLVLSPVMESGFSHPREEASVMQALESLSKSQISDFLSGRAPLVLAMRLGGHMMFIQLQLSTSNCAGRRPHPAAVKVPSHQPPVSRDHQEIPSPTPDNQSSVSHTSSVPSSTSLSSPSCSCPQEQRFFAPEKPVPPPPPQSSGAVIESMHHLGGGVYSGKFSGTVDPNVKELGGRRDISTIMYILKDLLGATPQYLQQQLRFQQPQQTFNRNHPKLKSEAPHDKKTQSSADPQLKKKVEHIQRRLEENRLRRRLRREASAPYHWNRKPVPEMPIFKNCSEDKMAEHSDNKVTSGYSSNSKRMENESLAV